MEGMRRRMRREQVSWLRLSWFCSGLEDACGSNVCRFKTEALAEHNYACLPATCTRHVKIKTLRV